MNDDGEEVGVPSPQHMYNVSMYGGGGAGATGRGAATITLGEPGGGSWMTHEILVGGALQPNYRARTWMTKDGRTLRPSDMTLPHLHNTVKLLEREYQKWKDNPPPVPDGASAEEANAHWEQYVRPRITHTIEEHFPIYVDLKYELLKRIYDTRRESEGGCQEGTS